MEEAKPVEKVIWGSVRAVRDARASSGVTELAMAGKLGLCALRSGLL